MQDPKLLIIEDDWIVANGLREMLRAGGSRVVGIAARLVEAEALVREHAPTLALVDINLGRGGDGVELARVLTAAGVRVVFTSAHADEATLARAREVGAHGFVVKPFSQKQIRAAIEIALAAPATQGVPAQVLTTHLATVQHALAQLAVAIGGSAPTEDVAVRLRRDPRLSTLSEREHAVLQGLLEHRRVPAIAEHLDISAHTVRNHLKSIFAKLHVSSQQELLDEIIDRTVPTGTVEPAFTRANRGGDAPPASTSQLRVRRHR